MLEGLPTIPSPRSVSFSGEGHDIELIGSQKTLVGWLGELNTTSVPNGMYSLRSKAYGAFGQSDLSKSITITINN